MLHRSMGSGASIVIKRKLDFNINNMLKKDVSAIITTAKEKFIPFCCLTHKEYHANWHHREIANLLERIEKGETKRAIIMVPPRHGKSTLATILFPAWYLGKHPDKEIITVSYSSELATDFGEKTRDMLKSPQYQAIFNTKIKADSESKQKWKTSDQGSYTSVGLGGAITGRGADLLIIDDPIKNSEEALSEVYREKIWNYYTSTLYTRLEKNAAVILILTRWHQDDLAGRLIEQMQGDGEQWDIIRFPAIADEDDKHRKIGEALWKEKYDLQVLENIKRTIGVYDWASLYQQTPVTAENQEFKKEYFKYYEPTDIIGKPMNVYAMVDLAISQKTSADNTSIQVIGKPLGSPYIYHLDEYTGRFDPLQVIDILFSLKVKYGSELTRVGIEGVQYQKALQYFIEEEQRKRGIYFSIEELKASGDKESRIRGLVPMYKAGVIFHRHIDQELENELLMFPVGKRDDRIDALAYLQQIVKNISKSESPSTTYYPHLKRFK